MTTFTYITDIPDAPNNPSQDQPNMKINTNSTANIFAVNHVGFNLPNGGMHNAVQMIQQAAAPTLPYVGQLYCTSINDGLATDEVFYFKSGAGSVKQMTRNFNPTISANGATFLPGGMIINWGFQALNGTSPQTGSTGFTQQYSSFVSSVSYTFLHNGAPTSNSSLISVPGGTGGNLTALNWRFVGTTGVFGGFYWMTIGF